MAIDCPNIFVMSAKEKKHRNSAFRALDNAYDIRYYKSHERRTTYSSHLMGCRSTVGRLTLDQLIGVRIPAPQPLTTACEARREIVWKSKRQLFSLHEGDVRTTAFCFPPQPISPLQRFMSTPILFSVQSVL